MADITKYVSHVSNATIMVVGHTDDVGNRDSNIILGEKRAEFIKNYLTQKGIKSDRITTESKGPDEPIDENATTEGKANNRRTVITIK
nr:OmpA family protein [uncultured Flavobacterium sp.]